MADLLDFGYGLLLAGLAEGVLAGTGDARAIVLPVLKELSGRRLGTVDGCGCI